MHCELCIKNIIFAPQNQALMSKHNLQIEEKTFKIALKAKSLTHIAITPPRWRFEIEPSVVNGQQTTDNSLRFCRLSLKKSYSKFNLQKSYLTKKSQGVLSCLAISYCHNLNSNNI